MFSVRRFDGGRRCDCPSDDEYRHGIGTQIHDRNQEWAGLLHRSQRIPGKIIPVDDRECLEETRTRTGQCQGKISIARFHFLRNDQYHRDRLFSAVRVRSMSS